VTIEALVLHRRRHESALDHVAVADLPTPHSAHPFRVHSFTTQFDGIESGTHVSGHLARAASGEVTFRMSHRRCFWFATLRLWPTTE
jgi:hypothetical protein